MVRETVCLLRPLSCPSCDKCLTRGVFEHTTNFCVADKLHMRQMYRIWTYDAASLVHGAVQPLA